ncbi:MAG TPA: hypothetical protein VMB85_27510 [Bryobacteraceae bacterium]|nr:hypothetical protein [Bryobacteraceae bacterium]
MFCGPTQTVCEIFYDVTMRGRHIYHLVWGTLLLMLVGYCWLVEVGTAAASSSQWMGRLTSMVYGAAAALTLYEFALWLNLRDVYWEREGRQSFDAMAAFGSPCWPSAYSSRPSLEKF